MSLITPDRIKALQKQTTDAIGIFTNTLRKLEATNKEIRQEKAKLSAKITKLEGDEAILDRLEKENETFTRKVHEFLGIKEGE